MPVNANIRPLAVKRLLFAGQLYCQTLELKPSSLTDKQTVLPAGKERVVADFNDCRAYSGMLAELRHEESEGPNTNHGEWNQQHRQIPAGPAVPES